MHKPPLILIIDDEPALLEIASTRLKVGGFNAETAENATDGHKKARELKPDLILLDMNMPEINGTQALIDLKNDSETRDIKVAFLTNLKNPWPMVSAEDAKIAKELGALDYINKAEDFDRIADKVKDLLLLR